MSAASDEKGPRSRSRGIPCPWCDGEYERIDGAIGPIALAPGQEMPPPHSAYVVHTLPVCGVFLALSADVYLDLAALCDAQPGGKARA